MRRGRRSERVELETRGRQEGEKRRGKGENGEVRKGVEDGGGLWGREAAEVVLV